MEHDVSNTMKRRHLALAFLILGVLLLCVDVRYRTGSAYPDYELQNNYGPETQRMIIEDVVGTRLIIDLASEALGYLCLFLSLLVVRSYARPEESYMQKKRKLFTGFGWNIPRAKTKYILIPFAGLILYIAARTLPYVTNGVARYGSEYFINLGLVFVEAAAIVFGTLCFLREYDCFQNHKDTQVIFIVMILTVFTGVMKNLAAFFGVWGVGYAYEIINALFAVAMCVLLLRYVRTEVRVAEEHLRET